MDHGGSLGKLVAAVEHFGEHDFCFAIIPLQGESFLEPPLRVIELVLEQRDMAQVQRCGKILRISRGDLNVNILSLNKLSGLKKLIGGSDIRARRLRQRVRRNYSNEQYYENSGAIRELHHRLLGFRQTAGGKLSFQFFRLLRKL
jgi:hypothetical protein